MRRPVRDIRRSPRSAESTAQHVWQSRIDGEWPPRNRTENPRPRRRRLMEHLTHLTKIVAAANQDHARTRSNAVDARVIARAPASLITTSGPMNGSVGGARAAGITEPFRTGNRPPGTADQCGPFTHGLTGSVEKRAEHLAASRIDKPPNTACSRRRPMEP